MWPKATQWEWGEKEGAAPASEISPGTGVLKREPGDYQVGQNMRKNVLIVPFYFKMNIMRITYPLEFQLFYKDEGYLGINFFPEIFYKLQEDIILPSSMGL